MSHPFDFHEVVQALTPVIDTLEQLSIPYCIGGSVASSVFGQERRTNDVDLIAGIEAHHVVAFTQQLQTDYYLEPTAIQRAIQAHSSFNVIYTLTMYKVDIFPWKPGPFAQQQQLRARSASLEPGGRQFLIASPEDSVLAKINWWKIGGKQSTRQWNDIIGILQRQSSIDSTYLRQAAPLLGVSTEVEEALRAAGIIP